MAKNFKNRLKTLMVAFMIALFFGQAAIACACDYEKLVSVDQHASIDHGQMHHHDMMASDQCDEPCVASALEINKADFSVSYDHALKTEQKDKFTPYGSVPYILFDKGKDRRLIKFVPSAKLAPFNNSLYSQAVLLRI